MRLCGPTDLFIVLYVCNVRSVTMYDFVARLQPHIENQRSRSSFSSAFDVTRPLSAALR